MKEPGFWEEDFQPPLSPLDGRYRRYAAPLSLWLSEEALNRARLYVEVRWLAFVLDAEVIKGLPKLTQEEMQYLLSLPRNFRSESRTQLAAFEAETRHDVKAVEYLLRNHLENSGNPKLAAYVELAHFLCTSEDINNLAYALSVKAALEQVWLPKAKELARTLQTMSQRFAATKMLARTHGQPATPTTLGKELKVFATRLENQLEIIEATPIFGKLNGATGTFSAHLALFPGAPWQELSKTFVESLGLSWQSVTTQIEPHDWQIALYDRCSHFGRIAHNLATDMWSYISLGYFKQQAEGTTGSSTMPHKVNPIRFENAEANLEMSDAIFTVLSKSLSTTRMQRDLSDSALQRNIGVAFGYSLVALENLTAGLGRLSANDELMAGELDAHPEVISEAIQQALRVGVLLGVESGGGVENESAPEHSDPYTALRELTRGHDVNLSDLHAQVRTGALPEELRARLLDLEPSSYTGLAEQIAKQ